MSEDVFFGECRCGLLPPAVGQRPTPSPPRRLPQTPSIRAKKGQRPLALLAELNRRPKDIVVISTSLKIRKIALSCLCRLTVSMQYVPCTTDSSFTDERQDCDIAGGQSGRWRGAFYRGDVYTRFFRNDRSRSRRRYREAHKSQFFGHSSTTMGIARAGNRTGFLRARINHERAPFSVSRINPGHNIGLTAPEFAPLCSCVIL